MPSEQGHKAKARNNVDFVNTFQLENTPFRDWAIVGMFYAAIHLVEGYLAQHDIHPEDHRVRQGCVSRMGDLRPVWDDYRALQDKAWPARYRWVRFSISEAETLKDCLSRIDQRITTLMKW